MLRLVSSGNIDNTSKIYFLVSDKFISAFIHSFIHFPFIHILLPQNSIHGNEISCTFLMNQLLNYYYSLPYKFNRLSLCVAKERKETSAKKTQSFDVNWKIHYYIKPLEATKKSTNPGLLRIFIEKNIRSGRSRAFPSTELFLSRKHQHKHNSGQRYKFFF